MRLVVLLNGAMVADVVSGLEPLYAGSDAALTRLHLPDTRLAPRQLLFAPSENGGDWILQQLEPGCPVKVNGRPVADTTPLAAGDEVSIADFAIRVYPEYEEKGPARSAAQIAYTRANLERFASTKLPPTAVVKRAEEPLTLSPEQVQIIGQAGVVAADADAIEKLMDVALKYFTNHYSVQRAWIGVRRVNYGPMEYEEGRLITGQSCDLPPLGHDLKPRLLDRGQFIVIPMLSPEDRTSVLAGPLIGPDGALGMLYLDTPDPEHRFEVRDLDAFQMMLNAFAYQLAALFKTLARNRAAMIEGQVSVAHETQLRLTPRRLPQSDELQWGAFREPGREQAGDVYDVLKLPNGHIAFMMAYSPTTGALPTILMAQAQSAFRYACMHQDAPNIFLQALNWTTFDGQKDHPLHCFAGIVDPASGEVRYSIAGDIYGYIISCRGEDRSLSAPQPTPALSSVQRYPYGIYSQRLEPEETLVVFSQGVTTARSRKGEQFGRERFVNILCDGFGQPASATLKEMLTDLRNFTEGGSQPNDITVLLAHRV